MKLSLPAASTLPHVQPSEGQSLFLPALLVAAVLQELECKPWQNSASILSSAQPCPEGSFPKQFYNSSYFPKLQKNEDC